MKGIFDVEGLDLIEQAVEAYIANVHQIVSALEESERESLTLLLRRLVLSFEQE